MSDLRDLFVDQIQDLLNAENQILVALPKMVEAAHAAKLKEAFEKHLVQTEGHVKRLKFALETLHESSGSTPCKGMKGILEEGQETIDEGKNRDELTADLALIAAAQKVEHYEICGYGTARYLAKQIGEQKIATLLSHTLGEEEAADFLLTDLTKPLFQQVISTELGNGSKAPWGEPGDSGVPSGAAEPHGPTGPRSHSQGKEPLAKSKKAKA